MTVIEVVVLVVLVVVEMTVVVVVVLVSRIACSLNIPDSLLNKIYNISKM